MEIIHVVLGTANLSSMNDVNRVVSELATQQQENGEKVRLWGITRYPLHDYPDRCYTTQLFRAGKHDFQLDKVLLKAIDTLGTDTIFHLHGGFIPAFYTLSKVLYERGIPFVLTPHGSYNAIALQKSAWRKMLYFQFFERKLLGRVRAIHCLGKSEVTGLRRIWDNDKTVLIPYGFKLPAYGCFPRPGKFVIGFCGRLDSYTKGLDLLLPAFSLFLKFAPDAELWIIGDGPDRKRLEAMAVQLGILNKTIFYGSRFDADKRYLLSQLHVFAHPSRNEGLPTAVLEAAALGIPCVVTDATNVGDMIRTYGCGEVVLPYASSVSVALMRLYRKTIVGDRMVLSENARRMVAEVYNWKHIITDMHRLYLCA